VSKGIGYSSECTKEKDEAEAETNPINETRTENETGVRNGLTDN
jgi:hypothetical protein